MKCICEEGYLDSMFNPRDGLARPFIVEFDNFGISDAPGKPDVNSHFAWGYDEDYIGLRCSRPSWHEFLNIYRRRVKARYPEGWV